MKKGDVVFVEWRDAYCDHGWMPVAEVLASFTEMSGNRVMTVGFFVGENTDWIAIVHSLTEDDNCNGPIVIPKGWIVQKRVIVNVPAAINAG